MNVFIRLGGIFLFLIVMGRVDSIYAADIGSQIITSQTQRDINAQKDENIEKKIYKPSKVKESSTETPETSSEPITPSNNDKEKFLVNKIDVQGATIPTNIEVYKIITPYQGSMMSLADAQKVADHITDLYRQKGFITSRAYIPPQTLKDHVLTIKTIEGKLGTVDVKGNRHFRTSLLKKELNMTKDGYFDYSALQRSLVYINQHPDREASTILAPGQTPGTTDVVVNVKDRLPIHAGYIYDNYGSRYIDRNRYALTLEDNNLLGFDDRMFAKVQSSDSHYMRFGQLQYVFPVTETLNVGVYGMYSHLRLTKEFAATNAKGEAQVYGLFFDKALVQDTGFEWRINGGFDYKDISNSYLGKVISHDQERVLKLGTQLDITDHFGRTIIDPEIDVGLPNFIGGMDSKDSFAARSGSGGSFQKWSISAYRLQPLVFDTSLLWKNTAQWSHYNLPAGEEFELGGPTSVRGYGVDSASGDKGIYSSLEWSVPPYFIPDSTKVPFTQLRLKDCLRLVTFYDIGFAHLNNVGAGEAENTTLRGWGYGVRLNVRDNLTLRFEVGYPLGKKPADGSHAQPWVELTLKY